MAPRTNYSLGVKGIVYFHVSLQEKQTKERMNEQHFTGGATKFTSDLSSYDN